jgi:hypothetical protein
MTSMRVRIDGRAVSRMLRDLRSDQVPFAIATAVNALAKRVADAEREAVGSVFDKATPFTRNAFAVQRASKAMPYAIVFAKDKQDDYLAPYETGGRQFLGSKHALLNPKGIALNQFGNLPKGALQRLKGRKNVFIGALPTKAGMVAGVWLRLPSPRRPKGSPPVPHKHRLLIRWGDAQPVQAKLHFGDRAVAVANANLVAEFDAAMAKAIATAK